MNTSQREHRLTAALIDILNITKADEPESDEKLALIAAHAESTVQDAIGVPDVRKMYLVADSHRVVPYTPTERQLKAVLNGDFTEGEAELLTADYQAMLDAAPAINPLENMQ